MKQTLYQKAIESTNIVSKTDINGIITFVNNEFCKITGYSKQELIGQTHNIIRHENMQDATFKKLWSTILRKRVYKAIMQNKAKNGNTFYVNTTIIPLLDENKNIKEFIAIRHDITEEFLLKANLIKKQRQLDKKIINLEKKVQRQAKKLISLNKTLESRVAKEASKNREKNRLLFQQSRLASMGEMIGNIAHQWRQPLAELRIYLFKMRKVFQTSQENEFEDAYELSKKVIERMSQTIEDFRNFFTTNKEKEYFCIEECIEDALLMIKGTLKQDDINVNLISDKKIKIYAYKSELTQVIVNIISNSKDAFKSIDVFEKIIHIHISLENTNNINVIISDNAGGIKKNVLDKIFEPYFTTKHQSQGTGLGLYISKMIIETSMKGSIMASNVGKGARFVISLPINIEKKDIK